MKIAIRGQAAYVGVIRELLSPWRISFSTSDEADLVIVYGEKPLETKKAIVIPSDTGDFMKWIRDERLKISGNLGEQVFAAASSQIILTITPQVLQFYGGSINTAHRDTAPATELNKNLTLLKFDVVKEYYRILDETMNAKTSNLYRLLTGSPIPYTLAPKRLRDLLMRGNSGHESLTFYDKLQLDALRFILVRAIEALLKKKLQRKTWNGKRHACLITHDIETRSGLQKARGIKKLEDSYDVPSAWYIPSKQYSLDHEIVEELANCGEVGAHGTWHDGELIRLPERKLVKRLREAKESLEKITKSSVKGFRAPLLQHSPTILRGLKEADYIYDTSIPTWEPKHPRTMRPHGVGTTYPLFFDTVTEIPLSTVQDCQLLYTLGLKPKETIAKWFYMMAVIKELGGCCVFLSHPEYKLFDKSNLAGYEELLNTVTSDEEVWLGTPKQLADEAGK